MVTKLLFGIFIVACVPYTLHAQDSLNYSTLSLNAGGSHLMNKDMFQSPYTYRGLNFSFGSAYTRVRSENLQALEFVYTGGHIQSIVSPKANNRIFVLNYDRLFRVGAASAANRRLNISAGIGLRTLYRKLKEYDIR